MSKRLRLWVLLLGTLGLAALFAAACADMPRFGGPWHPYGDRAVHAALARRTANTVSSVNFDQRAFDTLGEESILFGAVLGTVVLLRQTAAENRLSPEPARVSQPVRRYALLALPVTLLIGLLPHQRPPVRDLQHALLRRHSAPPQCRHRGGGGLRRRGAAGPLPRPGRRDRGRRSGVGDEMSVLPYAIAGWLFLVGCYGLATSRNLLHAVGCLAVCQSSTYVLLLAIGYRDGGTAPVFSDIAPGSRPVVDPVVQALVLTDIVIGATVTALLLSLVIQIAKRHRTVDPDELSELRG